MAQTVSRRPLTEEVQIQSQFGACDISGGQSDTVTGFISPVLIFPLSVTFHQRYTPSFLLSVTFHQYYTHSFPLSVTLHQHDTPSFPCQ
jgi:hypothetical protein